MEKKIVSIIVPVYNVEKYLSKCLDSLIAQTYKNIEIIVVDDGATDSCPQICDDYKKKDSRIIVVHKENGGLSDARNEGLKYVSGDYISFVDSDDYVSPFYVEILINLAEERDADISICNYLRVFENEETQQTENLDYLVKEFNRDEALFALFNKDLKAQFTIACSKLYRVEVFKNIRFPKGRTYEDSATAHKVYNQSRKVVYADVSLYFYLLRQGSIKTSEQFKKFDIIDAIYDRVVFFQKYGNKELLKMSYYDYLTCLMGVYSRIQLQDNSLLCERKQWICSQVKETLEKMHEEGFRLGFLKKMRVDFFLVFPALYAFLVKKIRH